MFETEFPAFWLTLIAFLHDYRKLYLPDFSLYPALIKARGSSYCVAHPLLFSLLLSVFGDLLLSVIKVSIIYVLGMPQIILLSVERCFDTFLLLLLKAI